MINAKYTPMKDINPMGLLDKAELFARLAEDDRRHGVASIFRELAARIKELEASPSAARVPPDTEKAK